MSEREFNAIFSERLRYYLNKYDLTQLELSKRLGVGTTSVYNWCNGIKTPRMDKVDAMCEIFHCKRSDLMQDKLQELTDAPQFLLTPIEKRIITEYRQADEISKAMVLRSLSINEADYQKKEGTA